MGKRAAERMNYRAGQLEIYIGLLKYSVERFDDINKLRAAIMIDTVHLKTIVDALRGDAREEYERGQEWFREEMARHEKRREAERIQTPIDVGEEL